MATPRGALRLLGLLAVVPRAWCITKADESNTEPHRRAGQTYPRRLSGGPFPTSLPISGTTEIAAGGEGYTGTLPTEIGTLTELTRLLMHSNELTGPVPSELGRLTGLTNLRLGQNAVTVVPSQVGQLTAITSLDLGSDEDEFGGFTSTVPTELGRLTIATQLAMNHNSIAGSIPSELGCMTALERGATYLRCTFEENLLTGKLPTEIGQLTVFKEWLRFNHNQFTGSIPTEVGCLTALTADFSLHTNKLSGSLPTELGRMSALKQNFRLHSNKLTGTCPTEIGALAVNQGLYLSKNDDVTGQLPTELGELVNMLSNFNVGNSPFSGTMPTQLGRLTKLISNFNVNANDLRGSLPTELGNMVSMTGNFQVGNNNLCGDIPTQVAALSAANYANDEDTLWRVQANNDLGSDCPVPTPMPTFEPSPLPTAAPTLLPTTPAPTPQCTKGQELVIELTDDGTWSDYCVDCTAGKYSNSSGSCVACRAGTYVDITAANECLDCPEGQMSSADRTSCGSCPAGTFVFNDTACNSCTQGKYAPSAQTDDCLECGEGYYTGETEGSTYCNGCEAGRFSPGLAVNCTNCLAGAYSPARASGCTNCSAGSYSATDKAYTCETCAAGEYQGAVGATSCMTCGQGTYQPATGQASCTDCGAGSFTGQAQGASTCTACAAGNWSAALSVSCTRCASGTYSSSGASRCTSCENGTYSSKESAFCSVCASGTWSSAGSSVCRSCTAGKYSRARAAYCLACESGKYAGAGAEFCPACESGTYSPTAAANCSTCPAGRSSSARAGSCTDCHAGRSSAAGQATCTDCTAGTYQGRSNASSCLDCPVGKFSEDEGSHSCTQCSAGKYADTEGLSQCLRCSTEVGKAYTSRDGADACSVCVQDYFKTGDTCVDCDSLVDGSDESGVLCPEGSSLEHLTVVEGYYRFDAASTTAYACTYPLNCVGGNTTGALLCMEGSEGPLCALCQPGFYMRESTLKCEHCHTAKSMLFLGPGLALFVLLVLGGAAWANRARIAAWFREEKNHKLWKDVIEGGTALFVTLQIVLLVKSNHSSLGGSQMPPPYGDFLKAISFLVLDIIQWLPLNCAYTDGFSAWDALVFVTISPIAIFILVLILAWVWKLCGRSERRSKKPPKVARVLGYFLHVMLLVLPTISRRICQTFRCSGYDDLRLLDMDLEIDCSSKEYEVMLVYAWLMVLCYPVGISLALYAWLWSFRKRLDPKAKAEAEAISMRSRDPVLQDAPITALALKFRPRFWRYELITLGRRLALTSLALMFQRLAHMMVFVLLLAILTLIIDKECEPYQRRWMSAFSYVLHWQLVLFLLAVIMMDADVVSGAGATAISIGLLLTNIFLVVFVFVIQRGDVKRLRREKVAHHKSVLRIQRHTVLAVHNRIRANSRNVGSTSENVNPLHSTDSDTSTGYSAEHGIELQDMGHDMGHGMGHEIDPSHFVIDPLHDGASSGAEMADLPSHDMDITHIYAHADAETARKERARSSGVNPLLEKISEATAGTEEDSAMDLSDPSREGGGITLDLGRELRASMDLSGAGRRT